MSEPLDKFGAFIVENLHDKMLYELEMLLRGGCKAQELQVLHSRVWTFTDAQKQLVLECAKRSIGNLDFIPAQALPSIISPAKTNISGSIEKESWILKRFIATAPNVTERCGRPRQA